MLLGFTNTAGAADDARSELSSASATSAYDYSNHRWGLSIDLHGNGGVSGLGLLANTPTFWDILGLRLGILDNGVRTIGRTTLNFFTAQAGIKLQFTKASSNGIYSYIVENVNYHFLNDADSGGSIRVGLETCYGAEWRFGMIGWGTTEPRISSVFIELGLAASDAQLSTAQGAGFINDGLVSRLGFRSFF